MGQYWVTVNLDKKEYVSSYGLGTGAKLWEQLANHPSAGSALIILCAAMPKPRGGGDFDLADNWHGPERTFPEHNCSPGPMPESYPKIAKRTIGRWAGDRIALIGDYAKDSDLGENYVGTKVSEIYNLCHDPKDLNGPAKKKAWKNVTADVRKVISHELGGHYEEKKYGDYTHYSWVERKD